MLAPSSGSAQPAVAIRDVTLHYFTPDRETLALSSVSLEVERGEFIAVVGSSGETFATTYGTSLTIAFLCTSACWIDSAIVLNASPSSVNSSPVVMSTRVLRCPAATACVACFNSRIGLMNDRPK